MRPSGCSGAQHPGASKKDRRVSSKLKLDTKKIALVWLPGHKGTGVY